jgi:hypothetical protein
MNDDEQELHEMLAEKRRLEAKALAADNAVLRQSLKIWQRFEVYPDVQSKDLRPPRTVIGALRRIVNGHPIKNGEALALVHKQFPNLKGKANRTLVSDSLRKLCDRKEIVRIGKQRHYRFTKSHPEISP